MSWDGQDQEKPVVDHAVHAAQKLAHFPDYRVAVARDNELQIDYDIPISCPMPTCFHQAMEHLHKRFNTDKLSYEITESKGGNRHVTILLPEDMPIVERVAWQAVFGSDARREAMSLVSIAKNEKNPVLFFEHMDRKPIVMESERPGRKFRE